MKIAIPSSSPEREFLEFWAKNLLDPLDPQNERWLGLEGRQIERGRRTAQSIGAWVPLHEARALDVGCQTGALAIALAHAGAQVTGIDVEAQLVRSAEIRAQCHAARADFRVARAEHLPFANESFDLVTFVDVIEHVDHAAQALAEVARVLRPGGVVFIQGPNRFSPRWLLSDPHYEMAGISLLPPSIGRLYVTRVRRRPRYDVGVFPIGSVVVATLRRLGLCVEHSPRDPSAPAIARFVGALLLRFSSMFTLVARKPRSQ